MSKIKVRFAPSPTGPLHIGGARSALFNYLFARHLGADMILRIEDTDLDRSRPEYEEEIITSLRWLGLRWEEGIDAGGENGPYRQTERLEIYSRYAGQLLDSGQAYYCFCSEEELENERQTALEQGEMPRYSGKCRHLTPEQRQEKLDQGLKPTIRFQVPTNKIYLLDDLVRGRVSFESDNSGDFIIVKSDGLPTYNFAVVVDDHLMGITHVIRAEEHLSNTPRQLMLYDALNLKKPEFAHISLILGSDRQKMSKRHGATSLVQYRDMGYLPEAMFNFLLLLGWSPEGEQELLTKEEAIEAFSLDRVSKSPAVFDLDKLNWINQQYLKKLDIPNFYSALRPFLEKSVYSSQVSGLDRERLELLLIAVHDRLVCLSDIEEYLELFLGDPVYEEQAWEVLGQEGVREVLGSFMDSLPASVIRFEETGQFLKGLVKQLKLKPGRVYMPVRCALTGRAHGIDLPYLIAFWGREESVRRIQATLNKMNS